MTPVRSWSARLSTVVAVVLGLLLAGVVLAIDWYAESRAEAAAAVEVQAELQTPAVPQVFSRGFPFLPQLITGRWSQVRVIAEDVLLPGGDSVPVRGLDMVLRDVTATQNYARIRAAQVEGTATLDFAALPPVGGKPLTYAGAGRVSVDLLPDLRGVPLEAVVVGRPVLNVEAQTITLADPHIVVVGVRVADDAARPILQTLIGPYPVTRLPPALRLTSLAVDAAGVRVGVAGEDVPLRG